MKGIVYLLLRIGRSMPLATIVWIGIPLLLGLLLVLSYAAQRELVDLFITAGSLAGMGWVARFSQALLPLLWIAGIAVVAKVMEAIQNMINMRVQHNASMLVQREVRRRALDVPLERMDQAVYYDRLQRAQSTAETHLLEVLHNVITIIRMLFEVLGTIAVAMLAHPLIGCMLVLVFIVSLLIRVESDFVKRRLNRDLTRSGRQSDYLKETITRSETIRDMRISGSIGYLIRRWTEEMRQSLTLRSNANRREIRRGMIVSLVQIAGLSGAVVWMLYHMQTGSVTPGTLVIVFQAIRQAYGISARMAFPIGKIYIQSSQLLDLTEFLNEPLEADKDCAKPKAEKSTGISMDQSQASKEPGTIGRIELDHVSYGYSGGNGSVLHDLNLVLRPGETVALVGENGAGKSTLVKLLLGLYTPTEGTLTWDGADYKALDPKLHRRVMSAAFQDFVRYETTLRDNVALGLPDAAVTDAAVHRVLQASGAAALAQQLPGGLDARLGLLAAGGRELSGGQWQRLAIARAALRDARLLVLDEPTSALDPQHETELYRSFRAMAEGRTALFVSHRLGWARYADRIVVLRDGRIVEDGNHDQLLAADSDYAAMFRAQAEWYRGGEPSAVE